MEHERTSLWAGLAVGMSAICALGLFGVVMYLLMRKSSGVQEITGATPAPQLTGMVMPGMPMPSWPTVRMPNLPPSSSAARGVSYATSMNSITLSPTQVSRLFTAVGTRHWLVTVREIGPPGTFAFIGSDPSSVMLDGGWGVNIVPAGGSTTIRLRPNDVLYGRGSMPRPGDPQVCVSLAAAEDDD